MGTIEVITGPMWAGKAQPDWCEVWTPEGVTTLKNLKENDEILTPNGVSRVLGIFKQGYKDIYRINFSDGTKTWATEDHLWKIYISLKLKNGKYKHLVCKTKDLLRYLKKYPQLISIPVGKAIFNTQAVPLDPYLLGVLIGDGSFGRSGNVIRFSNTNQIILNRVKNILSKYNLELSHIGRCDYNIIQSTKSYNENFIVGVIKSLGLFGLKSHEKFIPNIYKYNSEEIRLEILRGILDTDGSVDNKSSVCLEQSSKKLSEDVKFIVQSLGGIIKSSVKNGSYKKNGIKIQCRKIYRDWIQFDNPQDLFYVEEKRSRCKPRIRKVRRFIKSVTLETKDYCRCIKVSDPDGLYFTNDFIVTHNTDMLLRKIRRAMYGKKNVLVFKPQVDDRYEGIDRVCTHDGKCIDAIPVSDPFKIVEKVVAENPDVVAIDEVQFLPTPLITAVIEELADTGVRVIVSGTDTTFAGKPFGCMGDLLCIADKIHKLDAVCVVCGGKAIRNQRLIDGQPASADSPEIMVGTVGTYEPRCRKCHQV